MVSIFRDWKPGMHTPRGRLVYMGEDVFRACNSEITERGAEDGAPVVSGYFSTADPDIDQFVIYPKGWEAGLDVYMKHNPMFLWMHEPMFPIGRTTMTEIKRKGLFGATEFDIGDDLGANLYRKTKAKFLGTYSVGFRATKEPRFEEDTIFFDEMQLMEVSLVSIPANINAVVTERSAAVDEEALCQRMVTLAGDKWTRAADAALAEVMKRASVEIQSAVADIRKGLVLDAAKAFEERCGTVANLVDRACTKREVVQALESFRVPGK
jgi:HK97 family phage prohead protease